MNGSSVRAELSLSASVILRHSQGTEQTNDQMDSSLSYSFMSDSPLKPHVLAPFDGTFVYISAVSLLISSDIFECPTVEHSRISEGERNSKYMDNGVVKRGQQMGLTSLQLRPVQIPTFELEG